MIDNQKLIEHAYGHLLHLQEIWDEAKDGIEIPDDEYFESDAYYEGAIATTEYFIDILTGVSPL
jgi:hypothetical protein